MGMTLITVGKLKERFWKEAVAEYEKRLKGYVKLDVIEIADKGIEYESAKIVGAAASSHLVLLAVNGVERSSEDFSSHLEDLMTHGVGDIAFCIGGSDGVDASVYERADETMSFGPVTLPHNLARVVFLEQLYRAFKIMKGEPYHK